MVPRLPWYPSPWVHRSCRGRGMTSHSPQSASRPPADGALGSGPPFPAGDSYTQARLRACVPISTVDLARSSGSTQVDPGQVLDSNQVGSGLG